MPAQITARDVSDNAGTSDAGLTRLPLTRDLTLVNALSLVIAFLVSAVSVSSLLVKTAIYPTDELVLSFFPVNIFHLAVGVPILLGSMWLARRGNLSGLLCWPGTLLYVLYSYITCLIGVPFGALFLPYLLLVTLSAYTLIGLVACIDTGAVRKRFSDRSPTRLAGIILVGVNLFRSEEGKCLLAYC